jgi:anti-anti-sigma regulatory factor
MDIRISVIQTDSGVLLKVDGTLTAARLPLLEDTLATLNRPFTIDLSELRASDEDGIRALRRLRDAGAGLKGASPLIALRLGLGDNEMERR